MVIHGLEDMYALGCGQDCDLKLFNAENNHILENENELAIAVSLNGNMTNDSTKMIEWEEKGDKSFGIF